MLFHVAPECVIGVEALAAQSAGESSWVVVQCGHVLPLDGSGLERRAADLAQKRPLR